MIKILILVIIIVALLYYFVNSEFVEFANSSVDLGKAVYESVKDGITKFARSLSAN